MNTQEKVKQILKEFKVSVIISVNEEIEIRKKFIKEQLKESKAESLVLGLSGGVDSTVAGTLCKIAIEELNEECKTNKYKFVGVKLPYGEQKDADDVDLVFNFIKPHVEKNCNIKATVDAMVETLNIHTGDYKGDFVKGNIKARQRMVMQYAIANEMNGLVVGTDHSAEGVMGFFTKFGDGACDFAPLFGLNKRQVRALGEELNVPEVIIKKHPTADLEDLNPQLKDEDAYGVTYHNIDDFLEGKEVSGEVLEVILEAYHKTQHKRDNPKNIYS